MPYTLQTRLLHCYRDHEPTRSISPPIYQTSTWAWDSPEHGAALATEHSPPDFYTRYASPNTKQAEAMICALEGAEAALLSASGMAAITTAILANVNPGDHIIAQRAHYAGTMAFFTQELSRLGVEVTFVEQEDVAAFEAAITPKTRILYTETPTNPTMRLTDLAATAKLARQAGLLAITDNTFASSYSQRPLELGYHLVIHSATKLLNGHSDVTAGVIAGERALVDKLWYHHRQYGPVLHPFEAWLLRRGLQTYTLRAQAQNANAQALACALSQDPRVLKVHYPGLPSHPQHELACAQMPGGFGAMLSFEVLGGDAQANALMRKVKLATPAVSLGGMETLIVHPASTIMASLSAQQRLDQGLPDGLIRLSLGCESAQDILADLEQALG